MYKKSKLKIAPKRLIKKVGVKNIPKIRLDINTLIKDTSTADLKFRVTNANKIIILAIPGLIP